MFKPSEIAKFSRIFDDLSLKKVYQMSLQLTARVSYGGWEGGFAVETKFRRSLENAKKRGAYPKSGVCIVSLPSWLQTAVWLRANLDLSIYSLTQLAFGYFQIIANLQPKPNRCT